MLAFFRERKKDGAIIKSYNGNIVIDRGKFLDYHRLRWACRRGMLELDLILEPFLENVYPGLDEQDKILFQKLLEGEDQDLFNWFLNKAQPEAVELRKIVAIILDNTGLKVE